MNQTMADRFDDRIRQVAELYRQGDLDFGYRKLMDVLLDTEDRDVFFRAVEFTERMEKEQPDASVQWSEVQTLLETAVAKGVKIRRESQGNLLAAKGLKKTYAGGAFSLGPVDLDLHRGEVLGLVGENGNGKTTLLRILAQELRHDTGTIIYHLPKTKHQYDLRSQLAYIPQRTPKWYGPLKDNLKFTLSSYGVKGIDNEARVLMIIARLGLWKYRDLHWNQLSSGYKMRFELARTFLRCPDILLLDEPLANLDVLAQQTILEDLKSMSNSLANPMALVLSSQQLYEVEKCSDKVLFLKNGQPLWQQNTTSYPAAGGLQVSAEEQLIVEFDTDADRTRIKAVLEALPLDKLTYNGGTYIAHFNHPATMPDVLKVLGNAEINIVYVRNISKSTRRFFVNA